MDCLRIVSALLAVLLSEALPTAALPAVGKLKSVQKSYKDFEIASEDDAEPLYAYVYDYEDNTDQIWSDCSKLQLVR